MPDWNDTELDLRLSVEMVDPFDHASTIGELEATGGRVTWDADSDTLVSATLEVPDWSAWVRDSWLRIVVTEAGSGWRGVLGTFLVFDEAPSFGLGGLEAKPSLCSALKGLQTSHMHAPLVIGEGASVSEAMRVVCDGAMRPLVLASDLGDWRMATTRFLDAGTERLANLRDLAAMAGGEVDVTDDGVAQVVALVAPASASPEFLVDCSAPDTMVAEGSVRPTGSSRSSAGRSIVTFNGGDGEESYTVSSWADVGPSNPASPQRRGYVVDEVHALQDMQEATVWAAQAEALRLLPEDSDPQAGWEWSMRWRPMRHRTVVSFAPPGMGARKCQIRQCELDLSTFMADVSAREV